MRLGLLLGLSAATLAVAAAACTGGGGGGGTPSPTPTSTPTATPTPTAVPLALFAVVPSNGLATLPRPGVLVIGTSFRTSTTIAAGTSAATGCTVLSPAEMRCDFPAGTPSRVDVRASDPLNGNATLASAWTWTGTLNETDLPAELDFCNVQFPSTITAHAGSASGLVFGQFFEAGATDASATPAPGFLSQVGAGPSGSSPITSNDWRFFAASPNPGYDFTQNNDEYQGTLTLASAGTYSYAYRVSRDGGLSYTYCDLNGAGSNATLVFDSSQTGTITVTP